MASYNSKIAGVQMKKLANGYFSFHLQDDSVSFAVYDEAAKTWRHECFEPSSGEIQVLGSFAKLADLKTAIQPATNSYVNAVKAYAILNYERGEWSSVVECYSDAEIAEIIAGATDAKSAQAKMRRHLAPIASYAAEIRATAF